jgi:monofunctional glycosyltransferase
LSIFYHVATMPLMLVAKLVFFLNIAGMKSKLNKCINTVDFKRSEIPSSFVPYLLAAEDHRSSRHLGVDPIGMLRAFYVRLKKNEIQGASTIEQQFVRVVTNDYEHSLLRKFREQLLAISLTNQRMKNDIARAYLAIAYYGYNIHGTNGINKLVRGELDHANEQEIISIVARLKYPYPADDLKDWEEKHCNPPIPNRS